MSAWTAHVEEASGQTYYYNAEKGVSQWDPPEGWAAESGGAAAADAASSAGATKGEVSGTGGLSALAKRLREMQRVSTQQASEIERLERQLRIASDVKNCSVADIKSELARACQGEADGELTRRVAQLEAELRGAQTKLKDAERHTSKSVAFERENASRTIANLELRVGELEETEENLRAEHASLWQRFDAVSAECERMKQRVKQQGEQLRQRQGQDNESAQIAESAAAAAAAAATARIHHLESRESELTRQLDHANADLKQHKLKCEQLVSRTDIQDATIADLRQQLSSMYVAFEMMEKERAAEHEHHAAHRARLVSMDSALAKQLVQQEGATLGAASRPPLPPSTRSVGNAEARERQEAEDRAMALNLQRQLSGLQ